MSAFREQGRLIIAIPARFTRAEEQHWVAEMTRRVTAAEERRRHSDSDLAQRADDLAGQYLPSAIRPVSVTWVGNQNKRWGSCTPSERTIRISHRLQPMPGWVLDYVLLHELAHLLVPGHGSQFWQIVNAYPHTERARGFLDGVAHAYARGEEPATDSTECVGGA